METLAKHLIRLSFLTLLLAPIVPQFSASANVARTVSPVQAENSLGPCSRGDHSERCAAWAAVKSAEAAAYWARIQAAIAVVTTLGLIFSLWLTYKSVRHAEKTAKEQLRAYVYPRAISAEAVASEPYYRVTFNMKNFGDTPAKKLEVWSKLGIISAGEQIPDFEIERGRRGTTLTPGAEHRATSTIATSDVATAQKDGKGVYLRIKYLYEDYLGDEVHWVSLGCFAPGADIPGDRVFHVVTEEEGEGEQ